MTATRNLQIQQGVDFAEDFQILLAGTAIDLTGYAIAGTARTGELRSSPIAWTFTFVINLAERRIYYTVPRATTTAITTLGPNKTSKASTFFYDFELTAPANTVERIVQGKAFVEREMTRP